MGWIDDLKTRVDQAKDSVINDATTYFKARVNDEFVKVGQAANGNKTAAEIAAGQTGSTAPIASPQAPAAILQNAVTASSQAIADYGKYIPFVAIGVIALVFLSKKARR
jgi:hypothetical protein